MKIKMMYCLAVSGLASNVLFASEEFTFIPSVAYQQKQLSFDQKYSGAEDQNKANFKASLPMVNMGFSAAYNKFYISAKYETNISETPVQTDETDRSLKGEFNLITVSSSEVDVSRDDFSITFGYTILSGFNVFTGYLKGETTLSPHPFCNPDENDLIASSPCTSANRSFQQFFLGDRGLVENQPGYRQTYSESGFYIGGSYGFNVAEAGSLSFSLAYAAMNGEYRDNANDPDSLFQDESGNSTFAQFVFKGDTSGLSLGSTWAGSLGDTSAYFIDLRVQSYRMEGVDVTGAANFEGISLQTDEVMKSLTAGVKLYF